MNITVMYTCNFCMLYKQKLDVPARGVDEDVKVWMDKTMKLVGQDHATRSPTCLGKTCDLMIPISGAHKVGGPPIQ